MRGLQARARVRALRLRAFVRVCVSACVYGHADIQLGCECTCSTLHHGTVVYRLGALGWSACFGKLSCQAKSLLQAHTRSFVMHEFGREHMPPVKQSAATHWLSLHPKRPKPRMGLPHPQA